MYSMQDLYGFPSALASEYRHFRVHERVLLTGHAHQAWPSCCFDGQQQAWLDASTFVEERWDNVFEKSQRVRQHWKDLLDDPHGHIALAASVHDLVIRFISALPLKKRPRIVTTDGEYPSVSRQLNRLVEEGVEIVRVQSEPSESVIERIQEAVNDKTSAVFISSVFYETGHRVFGLDELLETCNKTGTLLFIDAYHSINVLPFSVSKDGLEDAYIEAGGAKYCQLGGGNCFLRFPESCQLKPVIAGWFGYFDALEDTPDALPMMYGEGHALFDGSTYDATSHYRADEVFMFFKRHKLTPEFLHQVNIHQVGLLLEEFEAREFNPNIIRHTTKAHSIGGFISLETKYADQLCKLLRDRGVHTDRKKDLLRLGPAPYLCDEQLCDGIEALQEAVEELGRSRRV